MSGYGGAVVGEELAPVRIYPGSTCENNRSAVDARAGILFGQELAPVWVTLNSARYNARHRGELDHVLVWHELAPVGISFWTCANRLSIGRHNKPRQHR